jgi:hypothetical protein
MADAPSPRPPRPRSEADFDAQRTAWRRLWDRLLAPQTPEERERQARETPDPSPVTPEDEQHDRQLDPDTDHA